MSFMRERSARVAVRNKQIIARYLAGETRSQLAEAFGMPQTTVRNILYRAKVRLPDRERRKRFQMPCRVNAGGRPAIWPDCPAELRQDYEILRRHMPSAEARELLTGGRVKRVEMTGLHIVQSQNSYRWNADFSRRSAQ